MQARERERDREREEAVACKREREREEGVACTYTLLQETYCPPRLTIEPRHRRGSARERGGGVGEREVEV